MFSANFRFPSGKIDINYPSGYKNMIERGLDIKPMMIEIEESKTENNILRNSLLANSIAILSENSDAEYPQKIFEIGRVFSLEGGKVKETENLAVAISPGNFTDIRQNLECLSRNADFEIKLKETDEKNFPPYFVEGRVAEILFENKKIGFIGEIHPKILSSWKIKMPVSIFEINLEEIFEKIPS